MTAGRTTSSPYTYDRALVRACLETDGLVEARLRWPDHVVLPIARAMGLTPMYRHSAMWNPAWTPLLGTKPDALLAGELGIPASTVAATRRKLNIKPFGHALARESRRAARAARLAALSDIELMSPMGTLIAEHKVTGADIHREREKRGITRYRHSHRGVGLSEYRRVCVIALRHAYPNMALEVLGLVLGITRERVRQIEEDLMVEATQ